jgi:polar amino acid transport system permease protein
VSVEPQSGDFEREAGVLDGVSNRRGAVLALLGLFWLWLVVRWVNDWLGGVLIGQETPFIPPETIAAAGAGVPVLAGITESLAFAFTHLPTLANAMWLTVVMTILGIGLGFFIAVPLAVARVYGRVSAYVSLAFTELIRGTPLLAQLFVLYYGLNLTSAIPDSLSGLFANPAVVVAIVGFIVNSAAYQAEYIRGAIESVDAGQLAAGRAIGLSKVEGIRFVVLPQALRFAIPGWSNELVYLIKYSSLAAFITVPELFKVANGIASENFRYTGIFMLTALLYLALVISAARVTSWAESETAIPGLGATSER